MHNGNYEQAIKYLEQSVSVFKNIGLDKITLESNTMVENITNLFYCYKQVGNNYNKQEIRKYLRKDNYLREVR